LRLLALPLLLMLLLLLPFVLVLRTRRLPDADALNTPNYVAFE
jgi:hypothetical protein